jgi:hypothetical protein
MDNGIGKEAKMQHYGYFGIWSDSNANFAVCDDFGNLVDLTYANMINMVFSTGE